MASSNCSVELPKVTNSISKPFSAKMPDSWATGGRRCRWRWHSRPASACAAHWPGWRRLAALRPSA